jgi:hypothetical protein
MLKKVHKAYVELMKLRQHKWDGEKESLEE